MSKWETGGTYPDISLLPEIARFFGITVDELLQAEQIDEKRLYREYEEKAAEMWRNGLSYLDLIAIWEEAYHKMPNNVSVKEMLMSTYFDADKVKYQNEIIELGSELYNSDVSTYYKGQAIHEIARTYAENNNMEMAERWAAKAYQLMHSQEMIRMQILTDGKDLIEQFRFANYWYFNQLFYMSAKLGRDENVIRYHLTRACECAKKSCSVTEHDLTHPLLMGWHIFAAPAENRQVVQLLKSGLARECFEPYRNTDWFMALEKELDYS